VWSGAWATWQKWRVACRCAAARHGCVCWAETPAVLHSD
jgi:hypothetical protein